MGKLFRPDYIFSATPPANGLYIYLLIVFGLMIVIAILLAFFKSKLEKIYLKLQNRIFNLLLTLGIIGLFFVLFRYEQIPYFGSRLMILLLLLTFLFWGGWIAFYWIFEIPQEKLEARKKQKFIKYLPQAAKRKIRGSTR
ncbi:MAG: hypothetical protein UT28_C0001G0679 [Berkelbacteria bacterium GW2011_GWE1_39_12]|uniref:Uncharacterized protein n=1 Tax=Berkelbacteria bacterium GW2011_GWE1_39_12 TaxID=1618337 RepID=A0A0G4B632_9BACT|nr:MAG: hypothetical protein UT28_C0001G0679 [Berkelbacteria bacterium GW2011_GWE1_39_12]